MDLKSNNTTYGSGETFDYGDQSFEPPYFAKVLQYIETFFITPLGILGNLLVIIILSQKKNSMFASSVFFVSLAVSDIITLVVGLYSFYYRFDMTYSAECKIVVYLAYTSVQLSSCFLVAVAFERVIGVLKPVEAKLFWTPKNARKAIFGIVFVLATFNSCFLLSYDLYQFDEFTIGCEAAGRLQYFMVYVYPWIDCIVAFVIPSMCIAVTSVIIIAKLKGMTRRVRNADNDRRTSITRALLSANIVFMATMAPYGVYEIISLYMYTEPLGSIDEVLKIVFLTISQLNASANFYLYFLSGPRFRADVKMLFQCFLRLCWKCASVNEANSQSADRNKSGQTKSSAFVSPENENGQSMKSDFVPPVNDNGIPMESAFVPPVNENVNPIESAFVPPVNENVNPIESAFVPPVNVNGNQVESAFVPTVNENRESEHII